MSSRRFTRTRIAGVVVTAAALVALAVGVAGAHKLKDPKTDITLRILPITPETATYDGKVKTTIDAGQGRASQQECARGRTVKVIHVAATRFVIGVGETAGKGSWKVVGPRPPRGDTVVAKVLGGTYKDKFDGDKHFCPPGKESQIAP